MEQTALWARRRAADENTSVSKLVGRLLEEAKLRSGNYQSAYENWKKLAKPIWGFDASKRLRRDKLYGRR